MSAAPIVPLESRNLNMTTTVPALDEAIPLNAATAQSLPAELRHLLAQLVSRQAKVGVVGLGYVGLPLLAEFARAGFRATGFDLNAERVARVNGGDSYIPDVASGELARQRSAGRLGASEQWDELGAMDAISICVPTPLRKTKDPDLSYIIQAVEMVAARLRAGQLIVLESTTYPGTTDEVVLPRLEAGGLKVGRDFLLAFSPERVDPGNLRFQTANIPKVVGGVTPLCTMAAQALYGGCVQRVVPVSSARAAEMAKLLENTFRNVNIALVNEIALLCHEFGLNVWEVIEAAASKPFGFMAFYPGPGLGGHCIPIDPVYLSWRARAAGLEPRLIEVAQQINAKMPEHVVGRITAALNDHGKALRGALVHVLGVAYKKDVSDVRESPALDIIHLLERRGARVVYSDPYVPRLAEGNLELEARPVAEVAQCDCAVVVADHSHFDYEYIARVAPLIVDTRNALHAVEEGKVYGL
ncbi:MAG: nucleotide sugar dehydrogenase [Terriglobales bacterium]